jgi:chemotaxis protein MotB
MNDVKPELVIIRRRHTYDDYPPKTGIWKIAYADFMTAMMAFFLVMWLLNALNIEQRRAVASYFNPIKLSEDSMAPKGLKDLMSKEAPGTEEGQDGKRQPGGPNVERRGDSPTVEQSPYYEDKILFRNPYATLSEIVARDDQASGQRRAGALTSRKEVTGVKGGEAYRDPFDPGYWRLAAQDAKPVASAAETETNPNPRENPAGAKEDEPSPAREGGDIGAMAGAAPPPAAAPLPDRAAKAEVDPAIKAAPKEPKARDAAPAKADKELGAAIKEALSDIKAGAGPVAEVREVEQGLLISLTDDASFGMFAVGSAEPRPELIRVIDKIGPLLTKHAGAIIVRGHTDNRPYRSDAYDNWRLSTARAQMAYYMLIRSGVDPLRIEHVEGYADRRPKIPSDPAAAQNRRIEIMVREKSP